MLKFENFLKALYEQNDNEDPNMDYIKNLLVKMSNYVKKHNVGGNVNKIENISGETGTSGYSGTSGTSSSSGSSGTSGETGTSGTIGSSGTSGVFLIVMA
jgi:hypothetical protein